MSDLPEAVVVSNGIKHSKPSNILLNNNHKRILRSKENLFKPKCNKELKKKLKKYKLRRDGNEDQDILDVSRILVTSLRIKSPNNTDKINNKVESDSIKPNNYLFKMVRKRKPCNDVATTQNSSNIHTILIDEESQNKQMDAFKLMMDSRNKSIGNNSPGKEKSSDETISQEILEKKAVKAKRNLTLQKMAESKGSLQKQEIEEYREICIKKKMLKRAELLKDMITKHESKIDKKEYTTKSEDVPQTKSELKPNKDIRNQPKTSIQKRNLNLCDMFSGTNTIINDVNPERVSDEDIEFLKKLSPSMRKKENMLCYFKKLSKDTELTTETTESNCSDDITKTIITEKPLKRKKKTKTLKPKKDNVIRNSVNKNEIEDLAKCDINNIDVVNVDNCDDEENYESRKRKRNIKIKENATNVIIETKDNIEPSNNENRPKRNAKKPVKYTEDAHCFSSDEELHIFTPKKKKNSENTSKTKVGKSRQDDDIKIKKKVTPNGKKDNEVKFNGSKLLNNNLTNVNNKLKKEIHTKNADRVKKKSTSVNVKNDKKSVKLAPIFVSKPQLSQAAIEAKQKFLKSGVPEQLKKTIVNPSNNIKHLDNFNSVVHVQQNNSHFSDFQMKDSFKLKFNENEECNTIKEYSFKSLMILESMENYNIPIVQSPADKILKCIKGAYPKFPVYRTYNKLKSKCKGDFKDFNYTDLDNSVEIIDNYTDINNDNPDKLNWCDKYKPTSSNQIIGNFESVKELKRWLEMWSEKLIKEKSNNSDASDMSDFYCSDMDSRDAMRTTNNILIVTGPTGSGKTSSVYAVASELAMKVIEVNASSKRNGKIMLQDLQEATQSHKVNRAKSSTESSQKSSQEMLPITNCKKRGRSKKSGDSKLKGKILTPNPESTNQIPSSQEQVRTCMSLILIDDADIVFDQDDGFCSAVSQLIQSSKRPVILVTSSPSCPHLQRFCQNGKIIHMRPFLPRMLGTWLDIMCLADVGKCHIGLGEKLLDSFKGDIRKTINCLQFYMNSYKCSNQTDDVSISQTKFNVDDESSSMSWADSEGLDTPSCKEILPYNIDKEWLLFPSNKNNTLNVFNTWWNLGDHFNGAKSEDKDRKLNKIEKNTQMQQISHILDTLSTIDCIENMKPDKKFNVTSTPWYSSESASLSESEDFEGYNEAHCINREISDVHITSTISEVKKVFNTEKSVSGFAPSMSISRERDRTVSRHHTLSNYLNPSAQLDRRATALDYWSFCRTICRLEKTKTDCSLKRNNRFCHYLKSLNILCRNEFFDNIADSLK